MNTPINTPNTENSNTSNFILKYNCVNEYNVVLNCFRKSRDLAYENTVNYYQECDNLFIPLGECIRNKQE